MFDTRPVVFRLRSWRKSSRLALLPLVATALADAASSQGPCASPLFPGQVLATGVDPMFVATGDLDQDGRVDIVVANTGSSSVSVLFQREGGNYSPHFEHATSTNPSSIAITDLDLDGDLDLAVACASANTVSVLLNRGDGSFDAHTPHATGKDPTSIVARDLDGDGDVDLAVCNVTSDNVSMLRNRGDGSFAQQVQYAIDPDALSLAVGDLDGDGDLDLVLGVGNYRQAVYILFNHGDATFAVPVEYGTSSYSTRVAVGDVEQDGDDDIVVAGTNHVSVVRNEGNGSFGVSAPYATNADSCRSLVVSDFDQDGSVDVAAIGTYYAPNTEVAKSRVWLLWNFGDGTFDVVPSPAGLNARCLAVGELDGDGRDDLALTTSGGVFVFAQRTDRTFAAQSDYACFVSARCVVTGDLDGDGDRDLVAAGGSGIAVLSNHGDGTFAAPVPYPIGADRGAAIGDLDGDGDLDLAATNVSGDSVSVFSNHGDGTFAVGPAYAAGDMPYDVAIGDLDQDGDLDLAVTTYDSAVSVLLNAGDGTFAPRFAYATADNSRGIAIGDLDGDLDLDLAVTGDNRVSLLWNLGNGTFAPAQHLVVPTAWAIAIGDLDGDGDPDVAVTNFWKDTVSVLRNLGGQSFAALTTYATGEFPSSVAIGDLDQDGDLDLAVATYGTDALPMTHSHTVSVLLNDGNANYAPQFTCVAGGDSRAVAIDDFDGDGAADLAVGNRYDKSISVFLNRTPCGRGAIVPFCFGDGSELAPCPCANFGSPGHGCASSLFASGGVLRAEGNASVGADSVLLRAQDLSGGACLFFQGDARVAAAAIDDGIGCVGGSLIRLRTKPVVGGVAIYPDGADASVSAQGAIGVSGGQRFYQAVYRNAVPSFCAPSTTNRTNGLIVSWAR